MSIKKWPGAVISDVKVEPDGNYQNSAASGVWTLEQQAYWEAQGLWPVPGALSPSAFIENLFSTYLYTGNGSTQTITNGIDLANEGGMVWLKGRTDAGTYPVVVDTVRGANKWLYTSAGDAQGTSTSSVTSFNSNGFSLGADNGAGDTNSVNYNYSSPSNYVGWTFRKAPKFFDVVTWTGNGVNGRQIPHNLGSVPGMVIVKCTNDATRWATWHRSLTAGHMMTLELTNAEFLISGSAGGGVSSADASTFTVNTGSSLNWVNGSTKTYVAYIFAHDAGGFGDDFVWVVYD